MCVCEWRGKRVTPKIQNYKQSLCEFVVQIYTISVTQKSQMKNLILSCPMLEEANTHNLWRS